ncbi:unnamed protein product, partial [Allacma fusca]
LLAIKGQNILEILIVLAPNWSDGCDFMTPFCQFLEERVVGNQLGRNPEIIVTMTKVEFHRDSRLSMLSKLNSGRLDSTLFNSALAGYD